LSIERKIKHPAVATIVQSARQIFAGQTPRGTAVTVRRRAARPRGEIGPKTHRR